MILTSCSEGDNALVVTDDKPWTISADDMDPNVRPGDDFFMYCNGGYWQSTYVREDTHTKGRDEYGVGKNVHSLERERVNGVVMNTDAWYDLFDVKPGDKFYRKPEERVHIW